MNYNAKRAIILSIITITALAFIFNSRYSDISKALSLVDAGQRLGIHSLMPNGNQSNPPGKTLVAIMRSQNHPIQPQLVNLFKPYLRSTDYLFTHPNYNNWNYAIMLPGIKGAEFFSLAEIRANAAILKAKGAAFISYDLEASYSPISDSSDPIGSMRQASQILHQNGLKLIATPSHRLTDKYYSSFAPLADIYILQAQPYQSNSSKYKSYVDNIVPKLRAAHPGMPIITELSTARGDLQSMKQGFSSVSNIVDGVASWYANTADSLVQLHQFLEWFQQNYR
jgi:hypothetical protein